MTLPIDEGTCSQSELAHREGVTDRTIRSIEARALRKLLTALRQHPDVMREVLDRPASLACALATLTVLHGLPRGIQVELTGRTWGRR